jgi:hypothetical protein
LSLTLDTIFKQARRKTMKNATTEVSSDGAQASSADSRSNETAGNKDGAHASSADSRSNETAGNKENRAAEPPQGNTLATGSVNRGAVLGAHNNRLPATPTSAKNMIASHLSCETPLPPLTRDALSPARCEYTDVAYWTPAKHYTSTVNIDAEMEALAKGLVPATGTPSRPGPSAVGAGVMSPPNNGFSDVAYWTPAKHYTSTVNIDSEMEALTKGSVPAIGTSTRQGLSVVGAGVISPPNNGFSDVAYWTPAKHYTSTVNIDAEMQTLLEASK